MVFADIAYTPAIHAAVRAAFGIPDEQPQRLHGGEESAAYRVADLVVRLAPSWRTNEEMTWFARLAAHASAAVPEVIAPRKARSGDYVIRTAQRPVSVWPFAAGTWPDKHDTGVRHQAAELLARLHTALADAPGPTGPVTQTPQGLGEDLADPWLDAWLAERAAGKTQALHGDYYRGNTLAVGSRITALLDWDDAVVGPVEREAAEGAWEWGGCLDTGVVDGAQEFLAAYAEAGGPVVDDVTFRQYARARMRGEILLARTRWDELGADDHAYHERQLAAYHNLRK
ncbi:MAG: phosphotransferase [Hamadaea sp.]|uniref:phosphotransferase enzyme family protein n=1 Tax=Hamadaea sp. TaxID=2024425 RepID=UPI0017FD9E84|nr:phosphotransferase [Hamadaea sp.]NUR74556.1 phosphotransferase [Hamadaea sp.]NUT20796.1 phosphotransferase [Hamadaea sp.]